MVTEVLVGLAANLLVKLARAGAEVVEERLDAWERKRRSVRMQCQRKEWARSLSEEMRRWQTGGKGKRK